MTPRILTSDDSQTLTRFLRARRHEVRLPTGVQDDTRGLATLKFMRTKTDSSTSPQYEDLTIHVAQASSGEASEAVRKLHDCGRLTRGWDGYDAEPPHDLAIHNAVQFMHDVEAEDLLPSRIAPSVVGGIGITFRNEERKAYLEFYNDGTVYCVFSDGSSTPLIEPCRNERSARRTLCNRIREFLAG